MSMNLQVVCISAGMLSPKKSDNPISRLHLYLNYGLLGLASILCDAGYEVTVHHGRFRDPEEVVAEALSGCDASRTVVLLSVPSSFALSWARRACREMRRHHSGVRLIVGGRWVVADDAAWIREQLPDADQIVSGLAEGFIVNLVASGRTGLARLVKGPSTAEPNAIPTLDYSLLDRWEDYHPSLEVSRGCGMGCSFCAEAKEPLSTLKDPVELAQDFARLTAWYQSDTIHPYLEASLFRPSTPWVTRFRAALDDTGVALNWRAETRVDSLSPKLVHELASVGLTVVDLGLESASPAQLAAMKKATQPTTYLRRASDLLRACKDAGVWAKVNILLHPGETLDSIAETEEWLERHRSCVKGVSVGPTILFRYGSASRALLTDFERQGASVVDPGALDRDGYAHLHLSPGLSHERAQAEAKRISRSFMSARDYFDLKSFSYFPRSLMWPEFCDLVRNSPGAGYSFRSSPDEAAQL